MRLVLVGTVLGSLVSLTAGMCADTDLCPSGAFSATAVVGYTCVDASQTIYGNTLDPTNLGTDMSGASAYTKNTQATCVPTSNYFWVPQTCSAIKAQTPTAQCGSLLTSFTMYAGAEGSVTSCCTAPSAPPPISPPISDDPCFPSSAIVTKAIGTKPSRIDALKEGDEIIAVTAEGVLTTDTVSLLSIAKPKAQSTFLTLKTATNTTLTLTPTHHVPVGAACCSTLKKAKDIVVGETMWAVDDGKATATTVTAKGSFVKALGLHSPVLVNGGFPVVDGVVTAFDSMDKVTLAKHGLAPLLKACKATGTCETLRDMFLSEDDRAFIAVSDK